MHIFGYSIIDSNFVSIIVRLFLAVLLGGLIGLEREAAHRPAGLRTHVLVCLGSALVMTTSEYMFEIYHGLTNADPARLGAQVISGVGFLGAGTIMREGVSIKGLTTAASIWTVACIGIAAGIGFYQGAIAATIIIYLVLILLKGIEHDLRIKSKFSNLKILIKPSNSILGEVEKVLSANGVIINNIRISTIKKNELSVISMQVDYKHTPDKGIVLSELFKIQNMVEIYENKELKLSNKDIQKL